MRNKTWCPIDRLVNLIGDRWSLLILRELSAGPRRFKELKTNISGISMDQLSRKLEFLCEHYVIVRQEFSEAPPRVQYQLTELGQSFVPLLKKLASWSFQNLWGAPQNREIQDVATTLRTMASLFGTGEGVILLRLREEDVTAEYAVSRMNDGTVTVSVSTGKEKPQAEVYLSRREWVKIVSRNSPEKMIATMTIKGDGNLLKKILPVFNSVEAREKTVISDRVLEMSC